MIINIVFLAIKLFVDKDPNEAFINNTTIFYYVSAFILFMVTWETNDWLIRRKDSNASQNDLVFNIKIFLITQLVVLTAAAVIYYLGIFVFDTACGINTDAPWTLFKIDMLRALGLGVIFSLFNQFYWVVKEKKNLEVSMLELKKEMMTSRYQSLKSQISPHFLFNSLNTLTSLMYEDRDLASDFVSRLASCYRYILDNREKDLIALEKELQFLDSFIFMMKVRHQSAILISIDVDSSKQRLFIPTLSIQMLVENALKHNFYSKEHPIAINIFNENGYLIIENNLRKRPDSQESTGLGLPNIKKRYRFYTENQVVINETEYYFRVEIPLIEQNQLQNVEPVMNAM
ncbi:MAG: histidine kinase [Bacteroidota bacterium]